VAFFIGDRSQRSCKAFWKKIPQAYKKCSSYSDFWEAYQNVFKTKKHCCVGKDSGQTSHVERWNNTLRQRISRYVRKTLSFSKSDEYHQIVTELFVINYNLSKSVIC
jgi:IS1 family transposase